MISEVTTTVVHVERITGVSGFIEAVFSALVQAIPDQLFAAHAGTSGNFCLEGYDPKRERSYVMYVISGGGYGGNPKEDGLSNGCSTIGISKTTPIEVMEQYYPVLFEEYSLHEGSSVSQKFADLLLTTESMVLTGCQCSLDGGGFKATFRRAFVNLSWADCPQAHVSVFSLKLNDQVEIAFL